MGGLAIGVTGFNKPSPKLGYRPPLQFAKYTARRLSGLGDFPAVRDYFWY
jgi:hypothetical protein